MFENLHFDCLAANYSSSRTAFVACLCTCDTHDRAASQTSIVAGTRATTCVVRGVAVTSHMRLPHVTASLPSPARSCSVPRTASLSPVAAVTACHGIAVVGTRVTFAHCGDAATSHVHSISPPMPLLSPTSRRVATIACHSATVAATCHPSRCWIAMLSPASLPLQSASLLIALSPLRGFSTCMRRAVACRHQLPPPTAATVARGHCRQQPHVPALFSTASPVCRCRQP